MSGNFLKSTGRPLAYTEIELVPVESAKQIASKKLWATTATNGAFVFADIPPGEYTLSINFGEKPTDLSPYATYFYPKTANRALAKIFEVYENTKITNLIFQIAPPLAKIKVAGKILDKNGKPAANVFLGLRDVEADDFLMLGEARTDANGNFTLLGFASRKYQILGMMLEAGNANSPSFNPQAKVVALAKSPAFILDAKTTAFILKLEDFKESEEEQSNDEIGSLIKVY